MYEVRRPGRDRISIGATGRPELDGERETATWRVEIGLEALRKVRPDTFLHPNKAHCSTLSPRQTVQYPLTYLVQR